MTQITFTHQTDPKLQLQFECRKLAKHQHYCLITFSKEYEETIKQQYQEIFESDIEVVDNKFERYSKETMNKGKNRFRRSPFEYCLSEIQDSLPFFVALNERPGSTFEFYFDFEEQNKQIHLKLPKSTTIGDVKEACRILNPKSSIEIKCWKQYEVGNEYELIMYEKPIRLFPSDKDNIFGVIQGELLPIIRIFEEKKMNKMLFFSSFF
jgi:hypothetical protein